MPRSFWSHSVVSDSLRPHGLQHARLPCPASTRGACLNSYRVSDAIQPAHPLWSPSPPAFSLSQHQGLSNKSVLCIRGPKYQLCISPSSEYAGLISFRIDWFDLHAVQGTQEFPPTLQFKSINSLALTFLYSATLTSIHDYHKKITLPRWTFVCKVMSLLCNMLPRFVIAFLPRSKCLLVLWLQSPSAVISEPEKIKPATVSIVSPSICHEVMELDAMIFTFWMLF